MVDAGRSARASLVRMFLAVAGACALTVALPSAANATITSVFTNTTSPIPCVVQASGVRLCDQTTFSPAQPRSTVKTFDGIPIDVRVAFPPAPASGPDGPYPLMMGFHGYAGSKLSLATMQPWLDRGYATFSMTDRGFGESCGTGSSQSADPSGCANGYVHLMDTRYEVRDAQELSALLVDQGLAQPQRIGAIGGSYGGGLSLALGALKDRKMLTNGTLVPWTSPLGTPMRIAAAAPEIPWSDLAYSLTPNGRTLDYVADAPYQGRTGVLKQSWENSLYIAGISYFYAPPGSDPSADLNNWHTLLNNGEPYDDASGNPLPAVAAVRSELTTNHSAYYIDHSEPPAPLLVSNGWTDDLFPPDEALRFYNRTRTQYPGAPVSLFFMSYGHQRGQNKAADRAVLTAREYEWMDYYVKGTGSEPFQGVETLTETCPNTAASGGPYFSNNWASLAPGEVRFSSAAAKTILPTAGSATIGSTFDPIGGGGACATTPSADQADTATYRSDPVPVGGYTLMGSPTMVADITSPGSNSQIAARLLDVNPSTNTQLLVARGLWRPAIGASAVTQVFQLHPSGYTFAAGHVVKLELLPKDSPYGRTSNGQQNVTIANMELRLPVVEEPGALSGLVQAPAAKFVPAGYTLALDNQQAGFPRPKGATPIRASLVVAYVPCTSPNRTHAAPLSAPSCTPPVQASNFLTVGTGDAWPGTIPNSVGSVRYDVNTGIPSDVHVSFSVTDVRNQSGLSDYTGELGIDPSIRITDKWSGADGTAPATVADTRFPITAPCAATDDTTIGATCLVVTSFNSIVPGAIVAGKRANWQLGQVKVFDGGSDADADTAADNTLFMVEGIFAP
jgi:predicted acyl esterase